MSRPRRPQRRPPYPAYPNDLLPTPVPPEAWAAAKLETYRFLRNQHLYQFDLTTLLACAYLQGVLDGAQVAQRLPLASCPEEAPAP